MTPRTLWAIILKIFGLYIFTQLLLTVSQLFFWIATSVQNSVESGQRVGNILVSLSPQIFVIGLYLFMFLVFIFKTDWLINSLKLDGNISEEKLQLNMHRSTVLQIAIIICGLALLIESVPVLVQRLFDYYQNINLYEGFKKYPSGGFIIFLLIKVLFSLFMVTGSRLIVNFIERKRRGSAKVAD